MNSKKTTQTQRALCNIYHNENGKVILELDMPGVSKDNLHINIEHNLLKIHGTRDLHKGEKVKGDYLVREIISDDYYQEYAIDDTIDREKVNAAVRQGLVRIELNVKESVLPRKIEIS
ncbi:MAG: Hsp20/alpha crystallin family protein [Candidatus Brocadiales bacterium]|nr:Hsp20/alpha crystallin family protein [Candidatus Brocadiales bacterium]